MSQDQQQNHQNSNFYPENQQSVPNFQSQMPQSMSYGNNYLDQSMQQSTKKPQSTQEQLAMKYQAYNLNQPQDGADELQKMRQSSQVMPLHSPSYSASRNPSDGYMAPSAHSQQSSFPYEKFNPQNQNLGPTQIFYQGPQNQTNPNPNPQSQTNAQLAGQQQQTQLLLLELLRQNSVANMSQQQNQQIQQQLLNQSIHNPSTTATTQNTNQPLFGQGFLSASQLLASSNSQQNTQIPPQNLNQTNQQVNTGAPSHTSGAYSQNLNNIYSYLNSNQSMMDQIERGNTPSYQNNQNNTAKVSPRKAHVEVDFGQQNNFEYKMQAAQQQRQDQSFDPSFSNVDGRFTSSQIQNNHGGGSNFAKKYENTEMDRYNEPSIAMDHVASIGQHQLNESLCGTKMSDPRQNEGQQQTQQFEDDSADIVWPSAHRKSKGIAEASRVEPENDGIQWASKVNQQNTEREVEWDNRPQQFNHVQSFSGKNFNSSHGDDSGMNLNRSQRNELQVNNQPLSGGRFSDRSATPLNIDDLPVPAKGAKTFEQLLEENLQDGAVQQTEPVENRQVPKKQFLKRKSQAYVPPKAPAKQYKYYTDAFESKEKNQRSVESDDQTIEPKKLPQNQAVQSQAPPRPQPQRQRIKTPHQETKREEPEKRATTTSLGPEQPRTNTTQMTKKPFLKRGTGAAGGIGRMANQKNKQSAPKIEKQPSLNQEPFRPEKSNYAQHTNRESVDEFEQIEQTVTNEEIRRQNSSPGRGVQNRSNAAQRKKKKLFDDSDSDEQNQQDYDNTGGQYGSNKYNDFDKSPKSPGKTGPQGQNRSNLVNKMFYKDQNSQQPTGSKKQLAPYQEADRKEFEVSEQMNEQMQDLLNKKQEELEKAIDQFNAQNDQLHAQKLQYDQMIRKVKLEQREIDTLKKRQNEDVEKMKEDAMQQIKKEKKALEQRQKNFQLVSSTAKREREEIDQLRREFNKYKADAELKAKKQTSQINALTKQNNELKQKNKELTEDLRALDAQRIALERSQPAAASNSQMQSKIPRYTGQSQNRYTFQQQNKSGYNLGSSVPQQDMEQDYEDQQHVQDAEEENMYGEEVDNQGVYQVDEEQEELENDQQSQGQEEHVEDEIIHGYGQKQGQQQQVQSNNPQNNDVMGDGIANRPAEEEEEDFGLKFPKEYHAKTLANSKVVDQIVGHDGKIQRVYASGKKEVIFNNGVKRESWPDGYTIVYFNNADIKQTFPDQKVVYYFAEAQTTQTTFPDKLQVFKFSNNQIEKHFPDKTKEIIFPDGTIKCIFEDGDEESIFPDGTIQKIEKSGIKTIEFANGQKDILYPDGIRVREFPDGKVRKTYPDGRSEVFTR